MSTSFGAAGQSESAVTLTGSLSVPLPEFTSPPPGPHAVLRKWFELAVSENVREPFAGTLSTVDPSSHRPTARTLMIKGIDETNDLALTFGTRLRPSLQEGSSAALTMYWREVLLQLNVVGTVHRLSDEESDVLFRERPKAAQAAAVVSQQSQPMIEGGQGELTQRARTLESNGQAIDRPKDWFGWRLEIEEIEFWKGKADRLHQRLKYAKHGDEWTAQLLQP